MSVPFYAWQAAGSLEDRRAYLQHLLSLGTSSLAFDKATGLAPLQAVQHKWQGDGSQQLAAPQAAGTAGWQPSPGQDVLQVSDCAAPHLQVSVRQASGLVSHL